MGILVVVRRGARRVGVRLGPCGGLRQCGVVMVGACSDREHENESGEYDRAWLQYFLCFHCGFFLGWLSVWNDSSAMGGWKSAMY